MSNESVFFNTEETTETSVQPEVKKSTGTKASTSQAKEFVRESYKEVIATMDDNERAILGTKSNTLDLKRVLGLGSKKDSRKVGGASGQMVTCDKPVALEFTTSETIEVPQLPVDTTTTSKIDFTTVPTRTVQAGETFQVTYFEAMLLLIRSEYCGQFSAYGVENDGYLSVNLPNYIGGVQNIPTPAFNLRSTAIKENIFRIDEELEDGSWKMKEGFEHYSDFLKKRTTSRAGSGAGKKKANTQEQISLTLQKAFGLRA